MRVKSPQQLAAGQDIYEAHCIGAGGYVGHGVISSPPYKMAAIGTLFVDVITDYGGEDSISLRDYNVIPNGYNKHRLYTDKRQAEAYLRYMHRSGLVPPYNNDFLSDDEPWGVRI